MHLASRTLALSITVFLISIMLSGCVADDQTPGDDAPVPQDPTSCDALRAGSEQVLEPLEIELAGDVVGQGTTRVCGSESGRAVTTWTTHARRDRATGQLGFVGRGRTEDLPAGECRWYPAISERPAADPTFGTCEAPSWICSELEAATAPEHRFEEVALAGEVTIHDDQNFYSCSWDVPPVSDVTWTSRPRRIDVVGTPVPTGEVGAIVVVDGVGRFCRWAPAIATRVSATGVCDASEGAL